jgi:hypothetical protein
MTETIYFTWLISYWPEWSWPLPQWLNLILFVVMVSYIAISAHRESEQGLLPESRLFPFLQRTRPTMTQQPMSTTFAQAGDNKIYLKLRRSQKAGLLGKVTFMLDARVELSEQARALVAKYGLGSQVIYDSKARQERAQAAYGHFDEAIYTSTGRSLWKNARGLASAAMMALSLRVTVNNLINGQHIECKDLDELLGAEKALVEACQNLKAYLETALTFDGREDLLEF